MCIRDSPFRDGVPHDIHRHDDTHQHGGMGDPFRDGGFEDPHHHAGLSDPFRGGGERPVRDGGFGDPSVPSMPTQRRTPHIRAKKLQMKIVWRYEVDGSKFDSGREYGQEVQMGSSVRRHVRDQKVVCFEECCNGDTADEKAPRADGTHPFLWHPFWEGPLVRKAVMVNWYLQALRRVLRDHILTRKELGLIRKFRKRFEWHLEEMRLRSVAKGLGSEGDQDLEKLMVQLDELENAAWKHMWRDTRTCDLSCIRCTTRYEMG
eukprot:TRINITY_DN5995_c0_g1_i2.p1 TRINITY_DN5995_c0_g1~~TRINITY_DN5995_c0_g1_i2.p1  ORF type:complete len:262 (+),score=27.51 TRINITY_DN5995_c0_g1_i2:80-865(+)